MENHRRKGATNLHLYVDAMCELAKRKGRGLEFDKSYHLILQAAKQGRFLSYKELADGSEAKWKKIYRSLGHHLWKLVKYSDLRDGRCSALLLLTNQMFLLGRWSQVR